MPERRDDRTTPARGKDDQAAHIGRRRFLLATAGLGVAASGLPGSAFAAGAFRDLDEAEDGARLEADIAIVGAGAAGITLARALAGRRARVLLIESGGLDLDGPTQELYDGEIVGLPYEPLMSVRQRFFGGTTNQWTGWCKPLEPIDLEPRPWLGIDGWPFGYEDLEPYYREAQEICELGPFVYDRSLWDKAGFEPAPFDEQIFTAIYGTRGPPTRFGTRYREDLVQASNVTVLLNANLTRIGLDAATGQVEQLDLRSLGGRRATATAARYVLACGGIENARLLLASNDAQAQGVGNQNDLVGRCFMEHASWVVGEITSEDPYTLVDRTYRQFVDGRLHRLGWTFTPALQERLGSLNCRALIGVETDRIELASHLATLRRALRQGLLPEDARGLASQALADVAGAARAAWRKYVQGGYVNRPIRRITLGVALDPMPNPDSRVTLAAARDALGMPKPQLDWRLTQADGHSVTELAKAVAAEFPRVGLGSGRLHPMLTDGDGDWVFAGNLAGHDAAPEAPEMGISYHHMGTTCMSSSPRRGVVDPDCRVHGIGNLFVAGSSVFPTAGSGSPTLTIVALALRLARRLEREIA